jgi:alpha-tubulin suppressor-like RCC1 family protein
MVNFDIPVSKVVCGSMFSGLLTSTGQVFTWGDNQHGQLGIKNQHVVWVQSPTEVRYEKEKPFVRDLACGFNHAIALSDRDEVYVWGKAMAVCPNVQLTYEFLTGPLKRLLHEPLN